jgi:hypothetical protein
MSKTEPPNPKARLGPLHRPRPNPRIAKPGRYLQAEPELLLGSGRAEALFALDHRWPVFFRRRTRGAS